MNSDYYKKLTENYDSIHPKLIFDYLLNYQAKGFSFPIFNYDIFLTKEFKLDVYGYNNNMFFSSNCNNFSLILNKYEKFCIKALHDYKLASLLSNPYYDEFIIKSKDIFSFLNEDIPNIFDFEIILFFF